MKDKVNLPSNFYQNKGKRYNIIQMQHVNDNYMSHE